jgi:transposase
MVDVHAPGDPVKTLTPRRQREAGGRCRPYPHIGSTPRCPGTPAGPHWPTRDTTPEPYRGWLGPLVDHQRAPVPITAALCWAHARRQFFELADIAANVRRGKKAAAISPIGLEAIKRVDALFDIERGINGQSAEQRLRVRKEQSTPLVAGLEAWLREQRPRLSRASSVDEPIDYMLRRWGRFARFIDDGRISLTNNAAERALRGFALGRKSRLFAGSERGADRAAAMATLITTAKLNDVDPQAWLADVLARIADHTIQNLDQLLPWNWKSSAARLAA